MARDGTPAWMEAQAMMVKAKNVMIEEAVDLLYKEIDAKRMQISGKFMPMDPEKSGEMEQALFLIRHLANEKENIETAFFKQMKELETSKEKLTPERVQSMESAKKFVLAVNKIVALVDYGNIFGEWFNDVSMHIKEKSPAEILANTAGGHRHEALKFLVKSGMFKEDGLFTKSEKDQFSKAWQLCESAKN